MSPYSSKKRFFHGLFLVVSGLLFSVVAAGCSLGDADTDGNVFYQIDQSFREVYRFLGGEKYMGPAITEPFTQNDVAYQYFKSGLLYWDWKREDSRYWHLAPLGLKLGVEQPPVEPPAGPDALYIGGHIVHPTFVPRYQQLGGEAVVGRPLTEARYEDNGNLRQYFSNLGFEVGPGQGPDDVRYLPYGEWSCDANCRSQPQLAAPNLNFTDEGIAAPPQRVELPGRLSMEPWHKFDQLGPQETQEIGVTVFAESKPLEGAEMVLYLTLPDGSTPALPMPLTDSEGQTSVAVGPLGATNAYLVPYEICLTHLNQEQLCVRGSYLVWENP